MPESEINKIFSEKLKMYCERTNTTQLMLSEALGVSQQAVSLWMSGARSPRMKVIDKICDYFHISRSDLLDTAPEYYENNDTAAIAQKIFDNKELRLLFDAAQDAAPEDLETVHTMLLALKRKENHEDDC